MSGHDNLALHTVLSQKNVFETNIIMDVKNFSLETGNVQNVCDKVYVS